MASPIGHGLVGAALARRLGVRRPHLLLLAAIAASAPDVDIIIGALFHRDPWAIHRKGTHTFHFALTAGAVAGLAGILRADSVEGERDLLRDALIGAAVVGSHILADAVPIPAIRRGPALLRMSAANWALDAVIWTAVARAIWPSSEDPDGMASLTAATT